MEKDSLRIRLPFCPPSVNSAYNVLYSFRRVELKPESKLFKSKVKTYVPTFKVNEGDKLDFTIEIASSWYYKNGNMRKKDVHNMVKILVDAICEGLGIDDKHIWNIMAFKTDSKDEEWTDVKIMRM